MKRIIALGFVVLTVTACAKRPDAISPAAIPMDAYSNQSCEQIAQALTTEQENLAALSKSQNQAATADAVGVFLIGAPLGSVTGGDKEGSIAVSKGKIQAMESARLSKGC